MKNFLTLISIALALVVAGCGANASPDTAAAESAQPDDARGGTGRGGPGGSGEVVQVSGSTAQVQNEEGQVAVTWTSTTSFTQQVASDLSAVTVGACVVVQSDQDTTGEEIAATSVRVSEATDGTCAIGAGTGAGTGAEGREGPEGGERTPPAGAPSDAPEGAADAPARTGTRVIGEVTAVSATGFTVSAQQPDAEEASDVIVSVSTDTTVAATVAASATDVVVGRCITSGGEADETGAITATTIAISDMVDDACATATAGQRPQAAE